MAFAVTKVKTWGIHREEPVNKLAYQYFQIVGTAANTDTAYDLGNYTGTFWTAVGGTQPGATGLKAIKEIQTLAQAWLDVGGPGVSEKSRAAAVAATTYTVTMNGTNGFLPDIAFNSGNAPTAFNLIYSWLLKEQCWQIECSATA